MSIGNTVRRFANETITVRRFEGFNDSGRWVSREVERFEIKANVQPARGSDLERLPEGYRSQGAFWVYPKTSVVLRTGSAALSANEPGTVADELVIDGVVYEVGSIDRWRRHRRYLAMRAQQ
jgi:hypothetical protein